MKCPRCGSDDSKVIESRDAADAAAIRRRRECCTCQARFTTYERIERPNLAVIKRSGEREFYDREKLMGGLMRACEKRPLNRLQLEDVITSIEREMHESNEAEVTSQRIGDMILDRLKELDPVAYIRFASVYKDFSDLESFERELQRLKENH